MMNGEVLLKLENYLYIISDEFLHNMGPDGNLLPMARCEYSFGDREDVDDMYCTIVLRVNMHGNIVSWVTLEYAGLQHIVKHGPVFVADLTVFGLTSFVYARFLSCYEQLIQIIHDTT